MLSSAQRSEPTIELATERAAAATRRRRFGLEVGRARALPTALMRTKTGRTPKNSATVPRTRRTTAA
jgi:hypothetical protein